MQRRGGYGHVEPLGGASPREAEILAFGLCNARLGKAAEGREKIEALNKTHQLWSLLVRDLASDGNRLPAELKEELIGIGFWAMQYAIAAAARNLSVQPLIDVNRNIADGLRDQAKQARPVSKPRQEAAISHA